MQIFVNDLRRHECLKIVPYLEEFLLQERSFYETYQNMEESKFTKAKGMATNALSWFKGKVIGGDNLSTYTSQDKKKKE